MASKTPLAIMLTLGSTKMMIVCVFQKIVLHVTTSFSHCFQSFHVWHCCPHHRDHQQGWHGLVCTGINRLSLKRVLLKHWPRHRKAYLYLSQNCATYCSFPFLYGPITIENQPHCHTFCDYIHMTAPFTSSPFQSSHHFCVITHTQHPRAGHAELY